MDDRAARLKARMDEIHVRDKADMDAFFARKQRKEWLGLVLGGAIVLVFLVGGWVGYSYLEARAFNRVTGKDVSTFEAMFVSLRVQGD